MRVAASLQRTRVGGRAGLLLALRDGSGRTGWGEAAPLPGYSPDDLGAAESSLRALSGGLEVGDADDDPRGAVLRILGDMRGALLGSPAARFAVETALLDLLGQRTGRSIAECLGGPRPFAEVGRNALLRAGEEPAELALRARDLVGRGIAAVKVKVGAKGADGFAREFRALEVLRRALPPHFELRLDANGAWTIDEARDRLATLAPLDVRLVEQPVAPELLATLGRCAVPWAADESLRDDEMAERLLRADGCVAFVLKPHVLGLLRAHDLACRAAERGLDVIVTHLFDGPVALAAACELALGLPRQPLACGLDPHDPSAAQIPHLRAPGRITASGLPGLGVGGVLCSAMA